MTTPVQIAANIANAQLSTGPRTDEGKAISSQNGIKHGLFTAGDFVRPNDAPAYAELNRELLHDLAPVGLLERNLVDEIRRAMWRMRRCGEVEANLVADPGDGGDCPLDPMETLDSGAERIQRSVDRARAQAHRLLHKCTAELRKLQTARQCAADFLPEGAAKSDIGIADWPIVTRSHAVRIRAELGQKKLDGLDNIISIVENAAAELSLEDMTMRTQSEAPRAA